MPRRATAPSGAKLAPLNIRTTQERRRRLEERAETSGRSLAQEVERLLDFALDFEEEFGGPGLVNAMKAIASAGAGVLREAENGLEDYETRLAVIAAIISATKSILPMNHLGQMDRSIADGLMLAVQMLDTIDGVSSEPVWTLVYGEPLTPGQFQNLETTLSTAATGENSAEWRLQIPLIRRSLKAAQSIVLNGQKKFRARLENAGSFERFEILRAFGLVHGHKQQRELMQSILAISQPVDAVGEVGAGLVVRSAARKERPGEQKRKTRSAASKKLK